MFVGFYTLGCKLNQLESEGIADAFKKAGFGVFSWEKKLGVKARLLIINTCTVTSKAEQKGRRVIREALRENPHLIVIITGCYAQLDFDEIEKIEERRLFVVKGDKKSALLDLPIFLSEFLEFTDIPSDILSESILRWFSWDQNRDEKGVTHNRFRFNTSNFSFHSRPFLKIQDGCDNKCSYCRVRLARGSSESLNSSEVLSQIKNFEAFGYSEVVLTGVNISQYRDGGKSLASLLAYILKETSDINLRLSSIEPDGISRELISVLGDSRIRPHFHLSVQSGSSAILERMERRYTPELIEKSVEGLRAVKGDPFLACDIITGFPGESDEDFEKTFALCQHLDFAWIHAFPYSRRPGTASYFFKESVPERESRLRADRLLLLADDGKRKYVSRWFGKSVEATVEEGNVDSGRFWISAVSANYLKLQVKLSANTGLNTTPQAAPKPGFAINCRIQDIPPQEEGCTRFDAIAFA